MKKSKLIRITTVPISLEKLLEGQLSFMKDHYDVIAISSKRKELEKIGKKEGIKTHFLPLTRKITLGSDLKALVLLIKFLVKEKPQIIHTHTPKAGIVGMLAAYIVRVPNRLHTVAGLPLMEATGFKRTILNAVERLTYRCATKVYPNSSGLKDFILHEKLCKNRKLKILGNGSSNGIDTTYFDPALYTALDNELLKESLNIPDKDFIFVFVGRLVGDKGINETISAFSSFQKFYTHSTLVLVGPLETALDPLQEVTLEEMKINSKIISVGFQNDVRPFLAFAKALVFPSYREGFPNAVLQAAAMGLPCIVSDINGCNEIITDGKNGIIIPPKKIQPLEKAFIKLYEDEILYFKMASVARSIIIKKYERKEIWNAILREYQGL